MALEALSNTFTQNPGTEKNILGKFKVRQQRAKKATLTNTARSLTHTLPLL